MPPAPTENANRQTSDLLLPSSSHKRVPVAGTVIWVSGGLWSVWCRCQRPGTGEGIFGLALAIQNLSWGVCAILAGALADKYGNLRVLLGGVALYAIGMLGMSVSSALKRRSSTPPDYSSAPALQALLSVSSCHRLPGQCQKKNVPVPSVLELLPAVSDSFWSYLSSHP